MITRAFWQLTVANLLASSVAVAAQAEVTVTGRVTDKSGLPIPNATVTVSGLDQTMALGPVAVLNGRVSIQINYKGRDLRCLLAAAGYDDRILNVSVRNGVAALDEVIMVPNDKATLTGPFLLHKPDGAEFIDFFVRTAEKPVVISETRLIATRKRETNCAEMAPVLTFSVSQDISLSSRSTPDTEMQIRSQTFIDTVIAASGDLEIAACDQVRLRIALAYPYAISKASQAKIRIEVPSFQSAKAHMDSNWIPLSQWDLLTVEVRLSDGEIYSSHRSRTDQ